MIYRCRAFKFQQLNAVCDWLFELLNNHPAHMARRIAFHKPLNADFHKYVLVQSFRYGGSCAWWGRHWRQGVFRDRNRIWATTYRQNMWQEWQQNKLYGGYLTTHRNEQDNGEGCEEIKTLSAYKLRINITNMSTPCRWLRCWWPNSAPTAQKKYVSFAYTNHLLLFR